MSDVTREESARVYDTLVVYLGASTAAGEREHFVKRFASQRTTEFSAWKGEQGPLLKEELMWVTAFPAGPARVPLEPRHSGKEAARLIEACNRALAHEAALGSREPLRPSNRVRPSALAERQCAVKVMALAAAPIFWE